MHQLHSGHVAPTCLLLRQLQPLQYEARVTTERSGTLVSPAVLGCALLHSYLCSPWESRETSQARSPSSLEKMHVYTKQGLSCSPHCSSVTLSLKNKNRSFPFLMSNHSLGPPAICVQMGLKSLPLQWLSLGPSCRTSTLPPISLSGLAPLLPGVPELAPPFFSLLLPELLQIELDTYPHLWQGVLTTSSANHHPNSAISSLHPDDWVKFSP